MDTRGKAEHTAMIRESQLAAGQIAAGATALGKANHAQTAYYHQAFFGLSIGIERLCKQIIIADYAIKNNGTFPPFMYVRDFGHKLNKLIDGCERIGKSINPDRSYADRPNTDIHQAIIEVLTEFADGTRYHNLNFLTGSNQTTSDPIARWWQSVGKPICDRHYSDKLRKRHEAEAEFMTVMVGDMVTVLHTDETGEQIRDFMTLALKTGPTTVAQKYGRMYTLQIVRWLAFMAWELSMTGGYDRQIPGLFCFYEPYAIFHNEDAMFRNRKTYTSTTG